MDSFTLLSNGANDMTCNNIKSDNIYVISLLTVSGTNILSSLNNINNSINNIYNNIGSASSLSITRTTNINFLCLNSIYYSKYIRFKCFSCCKRNVLIYLCWLV